ncbi:hypothetical protein JR316_0003281 [Psilocybe cubensis]|uniref:Uncharacterized protein n=1 Tax=Psilocybe cubensis TaxID=181762 RepID=A0ACB8H797_PSICU|nr:hypothetical protein JR316_0003281 [Psilocybe cubensis]KAH9483803.1 hypothetical protein JR316_0003281 [Psilocybe cubensis]
MTTAADLVPTAFEEQPRGRFAPLTLGSIEAELLSIKPDPRFPHLSLVWLQFPNAGLTYNRDGERITATGTAHACFHFRNNQPFVYWMAERMSINADLLDFPQPDDAEMLDPESDLEYLPEPASDQSEPNVTRLNAGASPALPIDPGNKRHVPALKNNHAGQYDSRASNHTFTPNKIMVQDNTDTKDNTTTLNNPSERNLQVLFTTQSIKDALGQLEGTAQSQRREELAGFKGKVNKEGQGTISVHVNSNSEDNALKETPLPSVQDAIWRYVPCMDLLFSREFSDNICINTESGPKYFTPPFTIQAWVETHHLYLPVPERKYNAIWYPDLFHYEFSYDEQQIIWAIYQQLQRTNNITDTIPMHFREGGYIEGYYESIPPIWAPFVCIRFPILNRLLACVADVWPTSIFGSFVALKQAKPLASVVNKSQQQESEPNELHYSTAPRSSPISLPEDTELQPHTFTTPIHISYHLLG